jgi:hypothetical protein
MAVSLPFRQHLLNARLLDGSTSGLYPAHHLVVGINPHHLMPRP